MSRWCPATADSSSPASATGSRRPNRPRCSGTTGITAAPLVPGQPHPARQPAGVPATDDAVLARIHVRLSNSPTGQRNCASSPGGTATDPDSNRRPDAGCIAASAGRCRPRLRTSAGQCGVRRRLVRRAQRAGHRDLGMRSASGQFEHRPALRRITGPQRAQRPAQVVVDDDVVGGQEAVLVAHASPRLGRLLRHRAGGRVVDGHLPAQLAELVGESARGHGEVVLQWNRRRTRPRHSVIRRAITRAIVVLPAPGGPAKTR